MLTFGQARPGRTVPVAAETVELLTEVIARLGDQGRLRMSVDRATAYFRSCGAGFILSQIGTPPDKRDPELSSIIFDDMMAAISTDSKHESRRLRPSCPAAPWRCEKRCGTREDLPLTPAERDLLAEWLNRLADSG